MGESLYVQIRVVVEPDGNGYHAYCPDLKGLHMDGETVEEALENMEAGIDLYLESLVKHGDALPIGPSPKAERAGALEIPVGAFLHNLKVQWPPIHGMSGTK